jgi:hypothetical protein
VGQAGQPIARPADVKGPAVTPNAAPARDRSARRRGAGTSRHGGGDEHDRAPTTKGRIRNPARSARR